MIPFSLERILSKSSCHSMSSTNYVLFTCACVWAWNFSTGACLRVHSHTLSCVIQGSRRFSISMCVSVGLSLHAEVYPHSWTLLHYGFCLNSSLLFLLALFILSLTLCVLCSTTSYLIHTCQFFPLPPSLSSFPLLLLTICHICLPCRTSPEPPQHPSLSILSFPLNSYMETVPLGNAAGCFPSSIGTLPYLSSYGL